MQPQAWVDRLGGIFGAANLQNQTSETVPHFLSHPTPMPSSPIFHCDTSTEKFWENNNDKKQTAKSLLMSVAAAKSLQSCLTLCDPVDGSPPGSSVLGILQARTLEWGAISFSNA